jgi:hypothetical protein
MKVIRQRLALESMGNSAYNIKAMEKIKIGISSCLLGNNVRYNGGHHDPQLREKMLLKGYLFTGDGKIF